MYLETREVRHRLRQGSPSPGKAPRKSVHVLKTNPTIRYLGEVLRASVNPGMTHGPIRFLGRK